MYIIKRSGFILMALLLAGCSGHSRHHAQGYVEGRYTYVTTSVAGVLKQLFVERGSKVRQGDTLLALDQQPESHLYDVAVNNLKQSIAARDVIAANLAYAKITYERYQILVPKQVIHASQLDNAKSIYESLVAQLAQANARVTSTEAALARAKWLKDQKTLTAPVDAIVFDIYYRKGEYAQASQPLLSLLAPGDIKVIFHVKEAILVTLKLNDKVMVQCDNCAGTSPGKISFISPSAEYTPPVIYSNNTNEKLVYRIEAVFAPNVACNMHPGQPVNVTWQAINHG